MVEKCHQKNRRLTLNIKNYHYIKSVFAHTSITEVIKNEFFKQQRKCT